MKFPRASFGSRIHLAPPSSTTRSPDLKLRQMISPGRSVFHLIGLIGGLIGGLLGIGGGSAIAPLLLLNGKLRPAQVSGTTLATVLLISLVGSGAYASLGHLNLGLAWPIAMGSVAGAVTGALVARRLSMGLMLGLFIVILPYFAVKELWPSVAAPVMSTSLVWLIALGMGTGFLSGLLGIGGASLVVPSLVGFFLLDHHAAQGIAITVALADSSAGALTHARAGNINYRVLMYMSIPAVLAALAGAFLSNSLPDPALRYLFVIFMAAVFATLLCRCIKGYLWGRVASWGASRVNVSPSYLSGNGNPSTSGGYLDPTNGGGTPRLTRLIRRGLTAGTLMNLLLVCVPLAVIWEHYNLGPVYVFIFSAVACVTLSYRLGQATESIGTRLGPVAGGLLNATFGNAAELIISVMALQQGLFLVVRTSLIGSIVGQLLLVLGTSLLAAGLMHKHLGFSKVLVQINFTLMFLAVLVIGLPSLLIAVSPEVARGGSNFLTPALAVLLLLVYGLAVVFSLRRQPEEEGDVSGVRWGLGKGLAVLGGSTAGIVLISEYLVGSILPVVESTGIPQIFIGLILIPIFSNVVDHIVAISVAMKNRMDLSLTISVGSAAQVACLVLPIVVLIAYAMGHGAGMVFTPVELIVMGAGLLLMVPVLLDGESNWLEGAQLLTCYVILGAVLWSF